MPFIHEPARATPVCHEADLCVIGGSCTGVFAAVRAARLGLSVALVEQSTILGGMAAALIEGRRLHRVYLDGIRALNPGSPFAIVAWAHALGIRETWHARCHHRLTGDELLHGKLFADSIAQGTYPVDIHSAEGTVLRYLDGREELIAKDGSHLWRRWQPDNAPVPACYHIPYRALLPLEAHNLLGTATLAHRIGATFPQLNSALIRAVLNAGGSLLLPLS